jgi:hypothetical protein
MEQYDKIKVKITEQIKNNLKDYRFTDDTFAKLKKTLDHERFKHTTVCAKIHNGKLEIIYDSPKKEKKRKHEMLQLIRNSISYYQKKNITFPDVLFYLYVSDTYAYQYQDLPLFIMAKPLNKTGILMPDNTFFCHDINQRCYDWTSVKDECKKTEHDKENVLFFAGANTDAGRQNIRSGLYKLEVDGTTKMPLKILLKQPKISLCEFKKFKYLLNLPGNQPWSYRFKYLFLMKSLVINVNVLQLYDEKNGWNHQWVNFFDVIFEKDVDYINIDYYWKENDEVFNQKSFNDLITKLESTYEQYDKNDDAYKMMAQSGYDKVNMITDDLINESIYILFNEYSKLYDFSKLL